MASLLYREDMDEVRARLTAWWDGTDLGRPMLQVMAPRDEPVEDIHFVLEPEGWLTHYSTSNFDYRVYLAASGCVNTHYLSEAVPVACPDLAPNCLALYLGCPGVEMPGTVWCEPCMDAPESARGPALDFCLVATQRRHIDDTGLEATPGAREWLLLAQAFAGPPTDGPVSGTRL